MIFGPKKVILIVGMNIQTPCAENGICVDCKVPARICNIWSVIERQRIKGRIHVKLVGENLGY